MWCSDLHFLWRIPTSAFPRVPPAKGNLRCLRFQTPDLQFANPRRGFDVCLNPRAPSSMLDGSLNVAVSPFELIAIKKKFCLKSHPQIGIHFLVAIASTHSTLTMGSQGFSLWLALVGAMQGKMAVLGSQALRLQRFNLYDGPHGVLKRCTCRASTFKMAVQGSQALRLPRFNLLDGRTGFSSAAPVTQTNGIYKIIVQTKSPTNPPRCGENAILVLRARRFSTLLNAARWDPFCRSAYILRNIFFLVGFSLSN